MVVPNPTLHRTAAQRARRGFNHLVGAAVGELMRSASRSFMKMPGFLSWVLCAALLHGAACSSSNRDGDRLLNAAALGDLAMVKSLVEKGAPINYRSELTF